MERGEKRIGKLADPAGISFVTAILLFAFGSWEALYHTHLYDIGLLVGPVGWVALYLYALYIGFRDRSSIEPRTVGAFFIAWIPIGLCLFPGEPSGTLLRYLIEVTEKGYWGCAPGRVFFGLMVFLAATLSASVLWERTGRPAEAES